MALLLQEPIAPEGVLGIWRIEETEEWFRSRLDLAPSEITQLERLKGRRRSEWLAARQLVHHMSGRDQRGAFWKDECGKPHITDSPYEISISHSHEMAAAIAAPVLVGIDIQKIVPKLGRLSAKFMRPSELHQLAEGEHRLAHLHTYWGAKEALYKAYGRRALDFREHILVQPFDYCESGGITSGMVQKKGFNRRFHIHYRSRGAYMLVYATASDRDA